MFKNVRLPLDRCFLLMSMLLSLFQIVLAQDTCGDLKAYYRKKECCGEPDKVLHGSLLTGQCPVIVGNRNSTDIDYAWHTLRAQQADAILKEIRSEPCFDNEAGVLVVRESCALKIYRVPMLLDLSKDLSKVIGGVVHPGGVSTDPAKAPVFVTFPLDGTLHMKIIDDVQNVWGLQASSFEGQRMVRTIVDIPCGTLARKAYARHIVLGDDGARTTVSMPVNQRIHWYELARGFLKYGPTFVTKMETFSEIRSDAYVTMNVSNTSTTVKLPLPNRRSMTTGASERVVVRGKVQLENYQTYRLTWPSLLNSTLDMFESVEGWLEEISSSSENLQLTFIHLYDSQATTSTPLDVDHPPPDVEFHHHQSYSPLFDVRQLSGADLVQNFRGSDGIRIDGATLETNFIITWEVVAGVAAAAAEAAADAGAAAGADAAATAAVDAGTDAGAEAAADAAADSAGDSAEDVAGDAGDGGDGGDSDGDEDSDDDDGDDDECQEQLKKRMKTYKAALKKALHAKSKGGRKLKVDNEPNTQGQKDCWTTNPCQQGTKNAQGEQVYEVCALDDIPLFTMPKGSVPKFVKTSCSCSQYVGFKWVNMPMSSFACDANGVVENALKLKSKMESYQKLIDKCSD